MDPADYVTMGDDIPVAYNDMNGYEERLLADLRRTDSFNFCNDNFCQMNLDLLLACSLVNAVCSKGVLVFV